LAATLTYSSSQTKSRGNWRASYFKSLADVELEVYKDRDEIEP